jgi:hypothetical protein
MSYFEIADQLANDEFEKPKKSGLVWHIPAEGTLKINGAEIVFTTRTRVVFKNGPVDFQVFNRDGVELTKKVKS